MLDKQIHEFTQRELQDEDSVLVSNETSNTGSVKLDSLKIEFLLFFYEPQIGFYEFDATTLDSNIYEFEFRGEGDNVIAKATFLKVTGYAVGEARPQLSIADYPKYYSIAINSAGTQVINVGGEPTAFIVEDESNRVVRYKGGDTSALGFFQDDATFKIEGDLNSNQGTEGFPIGGVTPSGTTGFLKTLETKNILRMATFSPTSSGWSTRINFSTDYISGFKSASEVRVKSITKNKYRLIKVEKLI